MKRFVLFSLLVLINGNALFAQDEIENDTTSFAQIAFKKTDFNFGDLSQGERAEHIFQFKNAGNATLVLQNVLSTCGCTVPEWPREAIPADSTGEIKVVFDSSAKIGRQNKVITIRSNSKNGDYRLRISAMVLPTTKKN